MGSMNTNQISTPTVSYVLLNWTWTRDDRTNFYRLRISFKRKSRYIKTDIMVHESDRKDDKGNYVLDKAIQYQLDTLVMQTMKKIDALDPCKLELMDIDELMKYLNTTSADGRFHLDFFEFAETVIAKKTGQPQKYYRTAVNCFKKYLKKDQMDISEISSSLMREWEEWLRNTYGNNARAVSAYTAGIAFIHNQAKLKYNNEETGIINIRDPFKFYKPPRQKPSRHRDVDISIIQRMIDLRPELTGREKLGVDVFLLSFGLMGMNAPDLYSCAKPVRNVITYNRTKTRSRRDDEAEMQVKIDKAIKFLADEYAGKGDYAFDFNTRYTTYQILGENVNDGLKLFKKRIDYSGKLTLYSARHSWATIAYQSGVNKGIINDCLCHVDRDMKVTDIYIKKDWKVMWDANEKVMQRFKWQA